MKKYWRMGGGKESSLCDRPQGLEFRTRLHMWPVAFHEDGQHCMEMGHSQSIRWRRFDILQRLAV